MPDDHDACLADLGAHERRGTAHHHTRWMALALRGVLLPAVLAPPSSKTAPPKAKDQQHMKQALSPSEVLRLRFQLETLLSGAQSSTGSQLERASIGLSQKGGVSPSDSKDRQRMFLADMVRRCKDLTPLEELVCRIRYCAEVGIEGYRRLARTSEVEDAERHKGETLVPGRGGRVADNPHLRWVEGVRARYPDFLQIAEILQLGGVKTEDEEEPTGRWAATRYSGALRKIQRVLDRE